MSPFRVAFPGPAHALLPPAYRIASQELPGGAEGSQETLCHTAAGDALFYHYICIVASKLFTPPVDARALF